MQIQSFQSYNAESFRFKVMEDLNTKYNHLRIEGEKREQILLNSVTQFDDKMDVLK